MPARHVVVDGSNIATEGNSLPSLKQLDQAVREFLAENPDDIVIVVVDATFGHRIPADEKAMFDQAELDGDIVSPPAGAIGRGDAFLLRVADKVGAVVLSNDSFQEFHGEYEWLFDKGRLIGGKPVPGVGWIFTPRSPVRGPRSRESVKEAKRKRHSDKADGSAEDGRDEGGLVAAERTRHRPGERKLQRAIAVAVEEAVEPEKSDGKSRRRRRTKSVPAEPLNEPISFITFIASHQLGAEVEGTVDEFSSHGAFISVGDARCYLPLSAMGDPPPRSARDALRKGDRRPFVVQAFDAMRRGIELAMPGFVRPSGSPTPETIDAEIHRGEEGAGPEAGTGAAGAVTAGGAGGRRPRKRSPGEVAAPVAGTPGPEEAPPAKASRRRAAGPAKKAPAKKAPATKVLGREAPDRKVAAAKKDPASTGPTSRALATKGPAKEAPAKEAPAKEAPAKKAPAKEPPAQKAPAKKAPAKQVPAKHVPAKEVPAKKAPAKKASATNAPAKKAPASEAPAKGAPAARKKVQKKVGEGVGI